MSGGVVQQDDGERAMTEREQALGFWSARFSVPIEELRLTWRLYSILNSSAHIVAPKSRTSHGG
jgi:hypothetical protein